MYSARPRETRRGVGLSAARAKQRKKSRSASGDEAARSHASDASAVGGLAARIDHLGLGARLAVATTSGFIVSAGAPRDGILVANFVGLVPLLLVLLRSRDSARHTFLIGTLGGMGVGLGGFPWIAEMLVQFAHVPTGVGFIGLLGFSAWMAFAYGIFALLVRYGPREGAAGFAFVVAAFVAVQASWPVLFPYTIYLGFAEQPQLMQFAEWIGVHGIEGVMVAAQLCLVRGLFAARAGVRWGYIGAWLATPFLMLGVGEARMATIDREAEAATKHLRIALVQPNVGIFRLDRGRRLDRLVDPSIEAAQRGVELIVWPEAGTFPYSIGRPVEEHLPRVARRVQRGHRTPVLFGAGSREPDARFGYNSTFLIDERGELLGSYDKVNLVPLGEEIPLVDPDWVTDWVGNIAHHHAGDGPARFELLLRGGSERVSMAPLICYEDIIPDYVRESAAQPGGVELLVNQTIDAWYGDSAEPWEHLALAQFRAVEHRIPVVRSVSTGVSSIIDANGRLVDYLPLRPVTRATVDDFPPELLIADLALARDTESAPTFYARIGWAFPHLCQLGVVAGLLRARSRRVEKADRG